MRGAAARSGRGSGTAGGGGGEARKKEKGKERKEVSHLRKPNPATAEIRQEPGPPQ